MRPLQSINLTLVISTTTVNQGGGGWHFCTLAYHNNFFLKNIHVDAGEGVPYYSVIHNDPQPTGRTHQEPPGASGYEMVDSSISDGMNIETSRNQAYSQVGRLEN